MAHIDCHDHIVFSDAPGIVFSQCRPPFHGQGIFCQRPYVKLGGHDLFVDLRHIPRPHLKTVGHLRKKKDFHLWELPICRLFFLDSPFPKCRNSHSPQGTPGHRLRHGLRDRLSDSHVRLPS